MKVEVVKEWLVTYSEEYRCMSEKIKKVDELDELIYEVAENPDARRYSNSKTESKGSIPIP